MKTTVLLCLSAACLIFSCLPSARFRSEENDRADTLTTEKHSGPAMGLDEFVQSWLHVPYHYGGMSKRGVDCSGFSFLLMRQVYGFQIPRTAADQYAEGQAVREPSLLPGDLVFFTTVRGRGIDHVGVYLGNQRFAHATESAGVMISEMQEDYYQERYAGACRYHK